MNLTEKLRRNKTVRMPLGHVFNSFLSLSSTPACKNRAPVHATVTFGISTLNNTINLQNFLRHLREAQGSIPFWMKRFGGFSRRVLSVFVLRPAANGIKTAIGWNFHSSMRSDHDGRRFCLSSTSSIATSDESSHSASLSTSNASSNGTFS